MARSNLERTQTTRTALLDAAHALFVARGYADTSTPDICDAAGITRGALYHHFADKRDLFRHVLERESQSVADHIRAASAHRQTARDALIAGSAAYLDAMAMPGRTRLLLVEGPAVLGVADMLAMDEAHSAGTLREGLAAALAPGAVALDALARLVGAAFDRAALDIAAGADEDEMRSAMMWLLEQVIGGGRRRR
jgi:AcrR family transcriptional regulator